MFIGKKIYVYINSKQTDINMYTNLKNFENFETFLRKKRANN